MDDIKLNHDVVKLLITKYIHPGDLVSFILVCKRFYKASSLDYIHLEYIRYITKKRNPDNMCNALISKKNFVKHLKKVSHNPDITMHQNIKLQCEDCKLYLPSREHDRFCLCKKFKI